MKSEDRLELRRLLAKERLAALSVVAGGSPVVGLVPFATRDDLRAVWIHVSALARHSAGLADGAPFALLIHAADEPGGDPFLVPRVSLEGSARPLSQDYPGYAAAREAYTAKLPGAARNFLLGDFTLWELEVETGRFVASFGRIHNLSPAFLRELAADPASAAGEPSKGSF